MQITPNSNTALHTLEADGSTRFTARPVLAFSSTGVPMTLQGRRLAPIPESAEVVFLPENLICPDSAESWPLWTLDGKLYPSRQHVSEALDRKKAADQPGYGTIRPGAGRQDALRKRADR